ncbi:unnamed protein product [Soboliphyme baturini]|uniref:Transmembrane protein n=1 Tax=Soboliphyme baturini TaxID=241478 RepID=A0A183J0R4_9BILA|nr:unnamed protein product [Soboliphyme baturini]
MFGMAKYVGVYSPQPYVVKAYKNLESDGWEGSGEGCFKPIITHSTVLSLITEIGVSGRIVTTAVFVTSVVMGRCVFITAGNEPITSYYSSFHSSPNAIEYALNEETLRIRFSITF